MTQLYRITVLLPALLIFTITVLWLPAANAMVLNTGSAEKDYYKEPSQDDTIQAFLLQETVQMQLEKMGVNPELAKSRVSALTPAEKQLVQQKITELPAGGGAVEVIGIVFIVLLILELLGVIDIFKKI